MPCWRLYLLVSENWQILWVLRYCEWEWSQIYRKQEQPRRNWLGMPSMFQHWWMRLKMERIQDDLQSQHKVTFVDLISVKKVNLILNSYLVDLVNLLKLTDKKWQKFFLINNFWKTSKWSKVILSISLFGMEDGICITRTRGRVLLNKGRLMQDKISRTINEENFIFLKIICL